MGERELGLLLFGWISGIIVAGGLALYCFSDEKIVIESKTKIYPEWKLITDGKKIDTIFIYKAK